MVNECEEIIASNYYEDSFTGLLRAYGIGYTRASFAEITLTDNRGIRLCSIHRWLAIYREKTL